jgi:iron complex transport system permease protein
MDTVSFFGGLFRREGFETATVILYHLRLPRLIGGLLAGVGLSVGGVLLQTVTGNPMASPSLVGVNAGAGFAVILTLTVFSYNVYTLPLAAFVGAFLTTLLIVALSARMGMGRGALVLTGLAIGAILSAGISFLSLLDTDVLASYQAFSVGSLAAVLGESLLLPAVFILLSLAASLFLAPAVDLLGLGDAMASHLGVRVRAVRLACMLFASASAAAAVSFAGLLGFVGLMAPHISSCFVGGKLRARLPAAALCGALLVVSADLIGRLAFAPGEMPVGVLMSLLGAPFFLFLLLKKGGSIHA